MEAEESDSQVTKMPGSLRAPALTLAVLALAYGSGALAYVLVKSVVAMYVTSFSLALLAFLMISWKWKGLDRSERYVMNPFVPGRGRTVMLDRALGLFNLALAVGAVVLILKVTRSHHLALAGGFLIIILFQSVEVLIKIRLIKDDYEF